MTDNLSFSFDGNYQGLVSQQDIDFLRPYLDDINYIIAQIELKAPVNISLLQTPEYQSLVQGFYGPVSPSSLVLMTENTYHIQGLGHPAYFAINHVVGNTAGVQDEAALWLAGAAGVNNNSTLGGRFIQEYTRTQAVLRGLPPSEVDAKAQQASNIIAQTVIADIVENGGIPTIGRLGFHDAGAAAQAVFVGGEYAPWAGTILFPALNYNEFTTALLLPQNVNDTVSAIVDGNEIIMKPIVGSYDLISSIFATVESVRHEGISFQGIGGALYEAWFGYPQGASPIANPESLIPEFDSWFESYYALGDTDHSFSPGRASILDPGPQLMLAEEHYIAGSVFGDQITDTLRSKLVLNAGKGDDVVLASQTFHTVLGEDSEIAHILDGDDGIDTLDLTGYESRGLISGLKISTQFIDNTADSVRYNLRVHIEDLEEDIEYHRALAYAFEKYILTGSGDELFIDQESLDSIQNEGVPIQFDGVGHLNLEDEDALDVADFSLLTEGITLDEMSSLQLRGFDLRVGSDFSDRFDVQFQASQNEPLQHVWTRPGLGNDFVKTGDGADIYEDTYDPSAPTNIINDIVNGGAGHDYFKYVNGYDAWYGNTGDDYFDLTEEPNGQRTSPVSFSYFDEQNGGRDAISISPMYNDNARNFISSIRDADWNGSVSSPWQFADLAINARTSFFDMGVDLTAALSFPDIDIGGLSVQYFFDDGDYVIKKETTGLAGYYTQNKYFFGVADAIITDSVWGTQVLVPDVRVVLHRNVYFTGSFSNPNIDSENYYSYIDTGFEMHTDHNNQLTHASNWQSAFGGLENYIDLWMPDDSHSSPLPFTADEILEQHKASRRSGSDHYKSTDQDDKIESGGGNDTIYIGSHWGNDTLFDSFGTDDRLMLAQDIAVGDIILARDGNDLSLLELSDTGAQISSFRIIDHFASIGAEVETLWFSDGSKIDLVLPLEYDGDGIDNDGDGRVDERFAVFYEDADGDGFGNESSTITSDVAPAGYVDTGGDLDDTDPDIHDIVLPANTAPFFVGLTDTTLTPLSIDPLLTNEATLFNLDADDAEGGPLSFSLAGADSAMFSLDPENGVISLGSSFLDLPPSQDGDHIYNLSVSVTDELGLVTSAPLHLEIDPSVMPRIGVEFGRVTTSQPLGQWHSVTFENAIIDAVVVMGPISDTGAHPVVARVRNVTEQGFEFQIDEWDYYDGAHGLETLSWMAASEGSHTFSDGVRIEAGSIGLTNEQISTQYFPNNFSTSPIVFAQVSTDNDPAAVTSRLQSVTGAGFNVQMQEEQAADHVHGAEEIDWIAIESGSSVAFDAALTADAVTHERFALSFSERPVDSLVFLADMQTRDGADPADLRYGALTSTSVEIFVEEEWTKDSETEHGSEQVGFLTAEEGFHELFV